MSLRDKLLRDLAKRKSAVRIAQVAQMYCVSEGYAAKAMQQMLKDGELDIEIVGQTYFYRKKNPVTRTGSSGVMDKHHTEETIENQ
jgi:hypothetical protein